MNEASSQTSASIDVERLIQSHQAGVWRYLRALGCEASQADDITQDTFVALLEKPFVEYSPAATASYLRKVAYNFFITAQRRAGRVNSVENVEQFDKAWTQWVADDEGDSLIDALRNCLKQLTERARGALEMRFRDRLPRVEIASALEITEHGAKNLMQRAKKQLQSCIESKLTNER